MSWFQKKPKPFPPLPPPKLHYQGKCFKVLSLAVKDPQILALRLIPYKPRGTEYQIEVERLANQSYPHYTHELRIFKISIGVCERRALLFIRVVSLFPPADSILIKPHGLAIKVAEKLAQYLASIRRSEDDTVYLQIDSLDFTHLFDEIVKLCS